MAALNGKVYRPDVAHNDTTPEAHYTRDKTFGHFSEDGRAYVVTDKNTPRPWVQYLCNDKVYVGVSNTAMGFMRLANAEKVTKHWEDGGNYIARLLNSKRGLTVSADGAEPCDFFDCADDLVATMAPGKVEFTGTVQNVSLRVTVTVPREEPAECWHVSLTNQSAKSKKVAVSFTQHIFYNQSTDTSRIENGKYYIDRTDGSTLLFTASRVDSVTDGIYHEKAWNFQKASLHATFDLAAGSSADWNTVIAKWFPDGKLASSEQAVCAYLDTDAFLAEVAAVEQVLYRSYGRNTCELPDKNLERFINVWLKNQINLTFRYDRGGMKLQVGYRDGLQDSWGYMLIDPKRAIEGVMFCLSYMYPDGRCPRQISRFNDEHDVRDFSDSPIWAPIALNSYIRETGDFEILNRVIPFCGSDETATVDEHIRRALDYMYRDRAANGLVRMRGGDWADGLEGINKYGADATSVWVTIAAYYAQKMMADIYGAQGDAEKEAEMLRRNADYKQAVNTAGWDGNWLCYAFFEDGEPIGSSKNLEGKIWLNPQTWGIFSGIVDDPDRIRRIDKAVSRYLLTPFGSLVLYPPYVFYGERNGRLQNQMPGTFLNSAVYNHAASFKVFADVARGDYDDAYDSIMRCLPNHPDNSDTRRTSEPFAVGNVYYGPDHQRQGMNLFSWFTATPSWLVHGGYEEILGVKAGFRGVEITPHVPLDWQNYRVHKEYRGTNYEIEFVRSDEKGIFVDGKKIDGTVVFSNDPVCKVLVKF